MKLTYLHLLLLGIGALALLPNCDKTRESLRIEEGAYIAQVINDGYIFYIHKLDDFPRSTTQLVEQSYIPPKFLTVSPRYWNELIGVAKRQSPDKLVGLFITLISKTEENYAILTIQNPIKSPRGFFGWAYIEFSGSTDSNFNSGFSNDLLELNDLIDTSTPIVVITSSRRVEFSETTVERIVTEWAFMVK